MTSNVQLLLNGRSNQPSDLLALRAGPLEMIYTNGSVRYIRYGRIEILRQIYAAVRDQNWGTVPGILSDIRVDKQLSSFQIAYHCIHQQGDIDFRWRGSIRGTDDGTVTFHMSGEAHSRFKRNRIGFCVLHPITCAGVRCRIEHIDGTVTEAAFPKDISPHQPFKAIRAIQHEIQPSVWAEVLMQGDTFEMEDQRNWTDASFKTYCTPLELSYPAMVEAGTHIEQIITLRLLDGLSAHSPASE